MMRYTPNNWYWLVGDDESRAWSSAAAAYVPIDNEGFVAWLTAGGIPTRILNEDELRDVLAQQYPAGWPGLTLAAAAQAALDQSDRTVSRCYEAGVPLPNEWRAYRADLRTIVRSPTSSSALPVRPDFPDGT